MKTVAASLSVIVILCVVAWGQTPASGPSNVTAKFLGPEDQWTRCGVALADVHPLWGGTAIHLQGSGQCVVRIVKKGQEKRFSLKLSPEEGLALRKLLVETDFLTIQFKDRAGVPDESRPRITLRNATGQTHEQKKWGNDKVEPFDKVYAALLDLQKKTEGQKADYEGPYQSWTPSQPATAAQPAATQPATRPVDANAVAELIRQLGDRDFKIREEATTKLGEMGDAIIPLLMAKAQEQGLDPEVAARITAVLPVQEGGVDFQIVTPAVWFLAEGTSVPLALKITNRTDKALQFNLLHTVTVRMKDAAGKELRIGAGRKTTAVPAPLLVGKGQSSTIDRGGTFKATDTGFRLTGSEETGGFWYFEGLKPGKYTVSIAYASSQAVVDAFIKNNTGSSTPFWIGGIVTKEVTVEILEKPVAATQPAAK